jgi:hypothetical protein
MAKSKKTTEENVKEWTPPAKAPKYRVVKGKSVMGIGGLFNGDDPKTNAVNAANVGGKDCLDELIEKKIVEEY